MVYETTVHDMKTHFSQYATQLRDGTYDEIIVKNRATPILRVLPYEQEPQGGLKVGIARELGQPLVDLDAFDAMDEEIREMFKEHL